MMSSSPKEHGSVAITAVGMVSSLGHDVTTGCAAARAGILATEELDYFPLHSPVTGEEERVFAHSVRDLTLGFEGVARLLRLAHAGLADLSRRAGDGPWSSSRTGFYLSLPQPRWLSASDPQGSEGQSYDDAAAAQILRTAARMIGLPYDPLVRFFTTSGHAGVAEAIRQAQDDLQSGRVGAAVVGGVDSLLEESTLTWLLSAGRLKSPGSPVGLQPGEAGAFMLLEHEKTALKRGGRPLALVRDLAFADEDRTLLSSEVSQGEALTHVLSSVSRDAEWRDILRAWLISDHNGENYRAVELGNALVRLRGRWPALSSPVLWYTAGSFGDVGAASGAVSICTVVRAFERNYAPSSTAVVASSSDGPRRSAIVLSTPRG